MAESVAGCCITEGKLKFFCKDTSNPAHNNWINQANYYPDYDAQGHFLGYRVEFADGSTGRVIGCKHKHEQSPAKPGRAPARLRRRRPNPPCPPGQVMVDGNCVDDDYYKNVTACNFICSQSSPSKECFPPDGICVPFISQIGVTPTSARTQLMAPPATTPSRRPPRVRRSLRRRSALMVKLKERGLA